MQSFFYELTKSPFRMVVRSALFWAGLFNFKVLAHNSTNKIVGDVSQSLTWERLSIPIVLTSVRVMHHCFVADNRP